MPRRTALAAPGLAFDPLEPRTLLSWSFDPAPQTLAQFGSRPVSQFITADFTGDGIPDLAAGAGRDLLIMAGRADGSFAPAVVALHLRADIGLLAVIDLNNDNRPDLVSAQNSSGLAGRAWVRSILNTTSGFRIDGLTRVTGRALGLVAGAIDADSAPDILILTERRPEHFLDPAPRTLFWLKRTPGTLLTGGPAFSGPLFIGLPALVDLDHDNIQEVLLPTAERNSASTAFVTIYDGRLALASAATGAWVESTAISLTGLIDAVSIVDTNNDTHPEAAFAVRGNDTADITSAFNRAYLATLSPGAIAAPTSILDRAGTVYLPLYEAVDHRIIGAADLNGDGRTDLLVSTLMSISYSSGAGSATSRWDLLASLIQQPDGSFTEIRVRSTKTNILNNENLYLSLHTGMVPYTLIPAHGSITPAVVGITRPTTLPTLISPESSSLQLLSTISVWKQPSVAWMSFKRTAPTQSPGPIAHVGDTFRLRIYAAQPEASRGGPVALITLYRDSDGDGLWTPNDELVALGHSVGTPNLVQFPYPDNAGTAAWAVDFTVPPSWLTTGAVRTTQTLFVRVVDATGVSTDPNTVRPLLFVYP